jgi:hypothetical protein
MKMRLSILLFLLTAMTLTLRAQSDLKLQSIYLYNFTRLMAWPDGYQSGDFIITVVGNSDIIKELENIATTRKAGNQRIIVKQVRTVESIGQSHIVYLPSDESRKISDIVSYLKSNQFNTLLITDSRNATKNGAMVKFTSIENSQKYELNIKNAREAGLVPGHDIVRLAIIVD